MPTLYNKKLSAYSPEELRKLDTYIIDWENHSRDRESKAADDLEKHLWLGNATALAISGVYIQLAHASGEKLFYWGIGLFLVGLIILVFLKYLSACISSRDRYRWQSARMLFETEKETDLVLSIERIRDKTFSRLRRLYHFLVRASGALFIAGCIVVVIGLVVVLNA